MTRVDRRLWLTASRDQLVEDGDLRAAFLWAAPGHEVPDAEAERLGYRPAGEAPAEPEPAPVVEAAEESAGEDEPADLQWSLGDEPEAPAAPAEPEPKTRRRRS